MHQVITKFGGTSVSSRKSWDSIVSITQQHINNGRQPIIVCSALTQISNKLEQAIAAALVNQHQTIEQDIRDSHIALAESLKISSKLLELEFKQLTELLTGIALLKA